MNKRECAIVSAYTGILCGKFEWMTEYVEEILGRPVWTHQLADKELCAQIKELSHKDFCELHEEKENGDNNV